MIAENIERFTHMLDSNLAAAAITFTGVNLGRKP
jgi:hypothetical protein